MGDVLTTLQSRAKVAGRGGHAARRARPMPLCDTSIIEVSQSAVVQWLVHNVLLLTH
eukprot:COSAG01_NODE_129_length_24935_cov_39.324368_24_plen_57_part_00